MADEQPITPQSSATSPFCSHYLMGGESSSAPLKLVYGLNGNAGYQTVDLNAIMAMGGGGLPEGSPTPPMDGTMSEGLETHLTQNAKTRRRVQNRQAQRRFRERKDLLHQALQQDTDDLRAEFEALHDEHAKSTAEVSRLHRENDALRTEVKDLRQQRRLVLAVLQLAQRGSLSPSKAGGDAAFWDYIRCCLGDSTDDAAPHSSG